MSLEKSKMELCGKSTRIFARMTLVISGLFAADLVQLSEPLDDCAKLKCITAG